MIIDRADTLPLRDYQDEAIRETATFFRDRGDRCAVVLPTGTGKTVTFGAMALDWLAGAGHFRDDGPGQGRVMILAHTEEIIGQTAHKLAEQAPGLPVGVVKAERNEVHAPALVAGVQTVSRSNRLAQLPPVGLLVIDECHHAAARTYRDVIAGVGGFDGRCKVVGFTATLARADGGLDEVFDEVVYKRDILDFVRRDGKGALLDARGIRVTVEDLNLRGVKRSGGDYEQGALGEALTESMAPEMIAKAYNEHGRRDDGTLRQGIVFTPTVDSAHVVAEAMSAEGIRARAVDGQMPKEERREIIRAFYDRDIDVICNCSVLTEGFDAPQADVVVIARPTTSANLYVQMVGRVLRPYPGQTCALVIDVTGVGARYRLATLADLSERQVQPVDGESLISAVEREDDEYAEQVRRAEDTMGRLQVAEFDLFGRSRVTWLRTPLCGIWFVPAGGVAWFLIPADDPGLFHVAWMTINGGGGQVVRRDCDLAVAQAWVEADVSQNFDGWSLDRGASWRSRPASRSACAVLESLRGDPSGLSAGEVSDRINEIKAGNRIDGLKMFRSLRDAARLVGAR